MKTQTIKIGTRAEIIEYITKEYPQILNIHQIDPTQEVDRSIDAGSPFIAISRTKVIDDVPKYVREQFIVSDYADIKLQREIDRIDNNGLRDARIRVIKILMEMEMDATERWDRILKVVDEFKNVNIPFDIAFANG